MATDLFRQILWNDGEELTFDDLNNGQRFMRAQLYDQVIESMSWNTALNAQPEFTGNSANLATHLAYCLSGGSAYLVQGSANNKLRISAGTLLQKINVKDGLDATLIPFTFDGTSTGEFTIAAGSATNPRMDLCQMKLEYVTSNVELRDFEDGTTHAITSQNLSKGRRIQCTLSVKSGTPAASPVTPDPDAGYVAVASVCVYASYAIGTALTFGTPIASTTNAIVYDQRMPLNLHSVRVPGSAILTATAWTYSAVTGILTSTNATNSLIVIANPGNLCSRLVGFTFLKDSTSWSNTGTFITAQSTSVLKPNGLLNTTTRIVSPAYNTIDSWCAGTTEGGTGPTIIPSTTNKIGTPMWSNGKHCASPTRLVGTVPDVLITIATGNLSSVFQSFDAYWAG